MAAAGSIHLDTAASVNGDSAKTEHYDDQDATWCLKVKDKFSLFGRHGPRIAVGGNADDGDAPVDDELSTAPACKAKPRDKDSEEPLLFRTVPGRLFDEMLHSVDAVAMIGLASDGKAALAALERRLPFFGLTFTVEHTKWLTKRLEGQVFKRFHDTNSKLFKVALVKLLTPASTPAGQNSSASSSGNAAGSGGRSAAAKKRAGASATK